MPEIKTVTKQGEVTININLTLTINNDGTVKVSSVSSQEKSKEISDFVPQLPELDDFTDIIDFGKSVN